MANIIIVEDDEEILSLWNSQIASHNENSSTKINTIVLNSYDDFFDLIESDASYLDKTCMIFLDRFVKNLDAVEIKAGEALRTLGYQGKLVLLTALIPEKIASGIYTYIEEKFGFNFVNFILTHI